MLATYTRDFDTVRIGDFFECGGNIYRKASILRATIVCSRGSVGQEVDTVHRRHASSTRFAFRRHERINHGLHRWQPSA